MQELIDADRRLILFAHGDGMQSCAEIACPEGVFYKFDHFEETDWNDETCAIKGSVRGEMDFFLMNHWMNSESTDLPSESNAEEFNAYGSLMGRFQKCEQGRIPNVVAVDFWDVGDVLPFVKEVSLRNAGTARRGER